MVHKSWSKGFTKDTHPSVRKISETMRKKKIDNFAVWRKKAKANGRIPSEYPLLEKNGDLAELIGVVLGDGHIQKFPRTERLLIFSNSNNKVFVRRYAKLVQKFFNKEPYVYKQSKENCIRISLYQKHISKRLGVPAGPRKDLNFTVPRWILKDRAHIIRYLRGLYEAEGSYSVHAATYTHKFVFTNTNQSLLKIVVKLLKVLGFSPHYDALRVQISRKTEVANAIELLGFRKY
ncbi:hypothetical protein C4568_01495 [Candidatus Parcubacteria bacterium]|nr:MAG: hypothetical protein C4568_01495 [Candidatus Parcubacteria bacterium]